MCSNALQCLALHTKTNDAHFIPVECALLKLAAGLNMQTCQLQSDRSQLQSSLGPSTEDKVQTSRRHSR